jgi:hypothetical protein
MLSNAEIARMRTTAEQAMTGTAVISTKAWVSDGRGGGSVTWSPSGTVSCRVTSKSMTEELGVGRIESDADWIITLPAETAVSTEDRIVADGETMSVTGVSAPRTWEITRRIEANTLEP